MKLFEPCAYLHIKKLNHTFATRRGGIKKSLESAFLFPLPFFFFSSPILRPSPKIFLNPSLRQHQSFQLSLRNIHSPFFSLFLPRCLSFLDHYTWIPLSLHGLKANDTSEQNTMGYGSTESGLFYTEGHTETSHIKMEN